MSTSTRDRIRALIVQYPGLHLREIARQMDISLALVQYHIPRLVESGKVRLVDADGTQRAFPATARADAAMVATLRDRHRLHLTLLLLEHGSASHGALCDWTRLGKSTVSFHLKRLIQAGLVTRDGTAYTLANPEETRELMETHQPTPDLVDRFASMWGDLYG